MMTAQQFEDWLADMKVLGLAKNAREAAPLLGVSENTMTNLRREGGDRRTALACAAILAGLAPYPGDKA